MLPAASGWREMLSEAFEMETPIEIAPATLASAMVAAAAMAFRPVASSAAGEDERQHGAEENATKQLIHFLFHPFFS